MEELKQPEQKLKNSDKEKINLTDPDGQIQKGKGGKYPGYRAQIAVDSKEQIIVTNDVTNQQCDTDQLIPMVEQIVQNVQQIKEPNNETNDQNQDALLKIKLSANNGYSSGKNLSDIEQNKKLKNIDPYIPDKEYQAKLRGKNTKEDLPF